MLCTNRPDLCEVNGFFFFFLAILFRQISLLDFFQVDISVKEDIKQQPSFQISCSAFHSVTGALYLHARCSIMGISRDRLLLSLFYCITLQSISNTAASVEPINHLAGLLKQIAAS